MTFEMPATQLSDLPSPLRLHIGGKEKKPGWKILNAQAADGVDFVGNLNDMSMFPDACCDQVYASHVLEHLSYRNEVDLALAAIHRIMKPGAKFQVAVPDLDILCRFLANPDLDKEKRHHVMRIIFGGQMDEFDFHKAGFDEGMLTARLERTGFKDIKRVGNFDLFDDTSSLTLGTHHVSLNMEAVR